MVNQAIKERTNKLAFARTGEIGYSILRCSSSSPCPSALLTPIPSIGLPKVSDISLALWYPSRPSPEVSSDLYPWKLADAGQVSWVSKEGCWGNQQCRWEPPQQTAVVRLRQMMPVGLDITRWLQEGCENNCRHFTEAGGA